MEDTVSHEMRIVRSKLPVFFHRRLLLVLVAGFALSLLLGARLVQLTMIEGPGLRARAEQATRRTRYLPTWRGTILDRNGEILARDTASWSLAVPYEVIAGNWAVRQSEREARNELGKVTWSSLDPDQQGEAILERLPAWDGLVDRFFAGITSRTPIEPEQLDRRRSSVRSSIARMSARVNERQRSAFKERQEADAARIRGTFRPRPIAEETQPHVLVTELDDDTAFTTERFADALIEEATERLGGERPEPLLELVDGHQREHPWFEVEVPVDGSNFPTPIRAPAGGTLVLDGLADHVLGSVRSRVQEEDLRRRPFRDDVPPEERDLGGYRPGADMVGARGIEAAMEDHLRGSLGVKSTDLETDLVAIEPALPGRDLQLTLDISLQARVQALLDPRVGLARVQQYHYGWRGDGTPAPTKLPIGTPLDGAVVVLDIEEGELLAMASTPSFTEGARMPVPEQAARAPFIHRAVESTHPPGSIVKPLIYAAAVTDGLIDVDAAIECNGHYLPDRKDRLRCWIYREAYGFSTHTASIGGPLDIREALMRSCNIYFYTLADRLGRKRVAEWYRLYGLDEPIRTGLYHEREVVARDSDESGSRYVTRGFGETGGNVPDRASSVPALGIGQGELTWSPLQAANAYATFVREGVIRDATLIKDASVREPRRGGDLELDPAAVSAALEGMRRAIEDERGTGHAIRMQGGRRHVVFDIPGIRVWGKTGTAQAPTRRFDGDGDGRFDGPDDHVARGATHAWFVGLVAESDAERPRYVIAALLEYGGSGGRAAGPIVSEVIRALIAEGYLDGGAS